jgi:putative addiction module component (TIGR02574 family)
LTHSCTRNNLINMSNLLDDIEVKAATLSAEERAALALYLIESLDAEYPTQAGDWESTWLAECNSRVARYESGEDRGVPLDQALTRARLRLR